MQYALEYVQYEINIARLLQCKVNGDLFRYVIITFIVSFFSDVFENIKKKMQFRVIDVESCPGRFTVPPRLPDSTAQPYDVCKRTKGKCIDR